MRGEDALDQETVPFDDATTEATDPLAPEEPEAATYTGEAETDPDDDTPWFVDWLSEKTVDHYGCGEIPHESNVGHPAFRRRGSAGETIRAAAQAQAAIAALIAQRPDDAAFVKAVTAAVEGVGFWALSLKADVDGAAWVDLQRGAERLQAEEARRRNHDQIAEARKHLATADDKRAWALSQLPLHPDRSWHAWCQKVAARFTISYNGAAKVLSSIRDTLDPGLRAANNNEPRDAA